MSEVKYVDSVALGKFLELIRGEIVDTAKQQIVDLVYPVGSIYMSFENKNPEQIFGGRWESIEGKFLLAADSTHISGNIGGNNEIILKQTDIPQFTGTLCAGTGNYGVFRGEITDDDGTTSILTNGVFSVKESTQTEYKYANSTSKPSNPYYRTVDFSLGQDSATQTKLNILPEYIAVYMWRRIEGNTTTFTLEQSKLDDVTQILA